MTPNEVILIALLEQLIGLATIPGFTGDGRDLVKTVKDASSAIVSLRSTSTAPLVKP